MDAATLELLLADARERHKADLDRHGQIYTRCGIYLGALALYINVLARFLDKPPVLGSDRSTYVFAVGCVILVLATVLALFWIMRALWGRTSAHTLLPSDWIEYVKEAEPWFKAAATQPVASVETLDVDIKHRMLLRFADAGGLNFHTNATRFACLHRASQFLAVGFAGLLLSATGYGLLIFYGPREEHVTSVRVVDPVETRPYKPAMAENRDVPAPPPSAPPPSDVGGQPAPATSPTSTPGATPLPPKPEPRGIRILNDGEVHPPKGGTVLND